MAATRPNFMSDRDAGSRDTVARKPVSAAKAPAKAMAAPAKSKGPANAGPVKTAGAPTPTKRPSPNNASRSPAPASNPSNDKQYATYSTSGATQSAKPRDNYYGTSAAPAAPAKASAAMPAVMPGMSTRKSVSNDQARYNMAQAGPRTPKKKFSLLSAMKQDTRKYMK